MIADDVCSLPAVSTNHIFCYIHMRFHKSYLLLEAFWKMTVNFLLRRATLVLWGVSHMTQHRLYLQCSLVNICLCSSFETSRRFLWGAFSLGKRNDIRQGLASSHVNSQWLVNLTRIVSEKTQWKWTRRMWQDSCDARFLWKRQGMWKRMAASHLNLQSHWTQDAFDLRKHTESGSVSATHVLVEKRNGIRERLVAGHLNLQSRGTQDAFYLRKHKGIWGVGTARIFIEKHTSRPRSVIEIYNQNEGQAHFTWENTRNLAGLAGVTLNFTGRMKPRRILNEKTQRFLRGWREWRLDLQSRWRAGAFYTRKHNDFSGVGGGLRKGCILIRNRDWTSCELLVGLGLN